MGDNLAYEIKHLLPAVAVFSAYGLPPNRSGFVQCPFHQGDRHASLKVYSGNKAGWYCFGCGAGGSVIDFAMRYFGISFREACLRLNEDFHLGLSDNKPSRAEISARLQAREKEDAKKEADSAAYYQVVEEHRRLLALKKALAPNRDAADYIHPLYAEAVKRLPYLEWWLEENIEMGR